MRAQQEGGTFFPSRHSDRDPGALFLLTGTSCDHTRSAPGPPGLGMDGLSRAPCMGLGPVWRAALCRDSEKMPLHEEATETRGRAPPGPACVQTRAVGPGRGRPAT